MNPDYLVGQSPFVAAFASTNLGDVSPNTNGPKCQDTGLPCDLEHSTCDGRLPECNFVWLLLFFLGHRCALPLVLARTCLNRPKSLLSVSTGSQHWGWCVFWRENELSGWHVNCCWSQQWRLRSRDRCSSSTSGSTCPRCSGFDPAWGSPFHQKAPVTLANGSTSHTCPPALGYSFAAGTTDGPGEFDFTQVNVWMFISCYKRWKNIHVLRLD